MRFLVDNQLPPALARSLAAEFGVEAEHVVDVGLRDASDRRIWEYVSSTGSVLISKDEDFANMSVVAPTATVVWVRVGNCRRSYLLDVFRKVWPRIIIRLQAGDRLVEIR